MDYRFVVLLQAMKNSSLSADYIRRILDPKLDGKDRAAVFEIVNPLVEANQFAAWVQFAEQILERSENLGVRWSYRGQPDYPVGWEGLSQWPTVFAYRGQPVWMHLRSLAVVGSRTPMRETRSWMQRELTSFLRHCPVAVVSGGARGVDQWAHRLAMDSGVPTVCIFPSGLQQAYPPGSDEIWDRIVDSGGALVSTFGLDQFMNRGLFHIRNRWIVGMSDATFVVEANRRSGSLLSAKLAIEEGRPVATLPVFPHSAQGRANLDLIVEGATLIRDHWDLQILMGRAGVLIPDIFQSAEREGREN